MMHGWLAIAATVAAVEALAWRGHGEYPSRVVRRHRAYGFLVWAALGYHWFVQETPHV